jgi:hypothetical protein
VGRRSLHRHESAIADTVSAIAMASDDSLGNFWSIVGGAIATQQTAPSSDIVAVILLTPKVSGLFRVSVDVGWSDDTTADSVAWRLRSSQVNVAGQVFTVGGTTPHAAGFGGASSGGGDSGLLQSSSASGMTLVNPAGGAGALAVNDVKVFASLTGVLTANATAASPPYTVHGIIASAASAVA